MPAIDNFAAERETLLTPISNAKIITPDDSVDLEHVTRAIMVGSDGDVTMDMRGSEGDSTITLVLLAGQMYAVRATRIRASGTTAGTIVAQW